MEGSLGKARQDGVPAETSAREDRYKEYLKEKRTEANRLKQRRLRERRAKHLEALEKKVLNLQQELVRATTEIQHLKANNARLETENRRLAEQLVFRASWDAGCGRSETAQHVHGHYTEQTLCPRPMHPIGGASNMTTGSAHNLGNMHMAVDANGAQGHLSEGQAPLSPPLSLYYPAESLDRPRQAGPPSDSGTNAQPVFSHPGHSWQALIPPARNSTASLLSVQSSPAVPHGPIPANALSTWDTGNAVNACSGATSVACSPTPFPPSLCSRSTAAMISRPDTPASSTFGTHPHGSSYPAYVNSGTLGFTAGTSFWPYTVDHAFVPRIVPAAPPFNPPHTSCVPQFALGPCSAVASAPQIASRKPVKGAIRAANAKPPLVPPGAGVSSQWTKDTGGGLCTARDQGPGTLLVMAPGHPVSGSKLFWPV